jgi:hypothetical protein
MQGADMKQSNDQPEKQRADSIAGECICGECQIKRTRWRSVHANGQNTLV